MSESIPPPLPVPTIPSRSPNESNNNNSINNKPSFQSRIPPTSAEIEAMLNRNKTPKTTERQEVFDERCFTRCRQTNARRALGREPTCFSLCYINMRNHINSLLPVPGSPGVFLAAMDTVPVPKATTSKSTDTENEIKVPDYHFKGLDGRYLYFAKGRELVSAHLNEMGGENWKGIEALAARCEAAKLEREDKTPKTRTGRQEQLAIRRSLGLTDEESYEKLISLTEFYSTNLQSFHRHCVRIYSPLFKNLARLPETFRDGTQLTMLNTIYGKLSDGSAYTLAARMYQSTIDVAKQLKQRRSGGDSSDSSSPGGLGGIGGVGGIGGLGGGGTPAS